MIDTLDNLYKGGRITQISAVLGTALQIKPLLSIQGGEVTVWGKVRTRKRALKRLEEEVRSWGSLVEMSVLHGGAEDLARKLADSLQDLVPAERVLFQPAGSALISHLGLGAVGVAAVAADAA
jgi:DegV family protein with EDD domain